MRGYHCPRKAGWDTHGLPVEHEIEKELGIFDKKRIEQEVGIAEFTRRCRESVMRYIGAWEEMTERMGFWVNMRDAYYTLDSDYIESVWWLLKRIWERGLIYRGYKVVPYDPRIGATLSSHEVALGYREVEDPSVFVRFPVTDAEGTSFLVWTTTPWTLPSNLALRGAPGSGLRLRPLPRRDPHSRPAPRRGGAARRSPRDREGGQGRGARRHALPAPLRPSAGRGSHMPGAVRRLRLHRGRHRRGPLRSRLRGGRREARPGARTPGGARRRTRRQVRARGDPGRRPLLQGRRPGARR